MPIAAEAIDLADRVTRLERQVAALLSPSGAIAAGALPEGMVRRAEAARLLGLKQTTLNRWAVRRAGPTFVLIRNRAYYRRDDLMKWLRENVRQAERGARRGALTDTPLLAGL